MPVKNMAIHDPFFIKKVEEKKKHENKKLVCGAGFDYVSLSHIP